MFENNNMLPYLQKYYINIILQIASRGWCNILHLVFDYSLKYRNDLITKVDSGIIELCTGNHEIKGPIYPLLIQYAIDNELYSTGILIFKKAYDRALAKFNVKALYKLAYMSLSNDCEYLVNQIKLIPYGINKDGLSLDYELFIHNLLVGAEINISEVLHALYLFAKHSTQNNMDDLKYLIKLLVKFAIYYNKTLIIDRIIEFVNKYNLHSIFTVVLLVNDAKNTQDQENILESNDQINYRLLPFSLDDIDSSANNGFNKKYLSVDNITAATYLYLLSFLDKRNLIDELYISRKKRFLTDNYAINVLQNICDNRPIPILRNEIYFLIMFNCIRFHKTDISAIYNDYEKYAKLPLRALLYRSHILLRFAIKLCDINNLKFLLACYGKYGGVFNNNGKFNNPAFILNRQDIIKMAINTNNINIICEIFTHIMNYGNDEILMHLFSGLASNAKKYETDPKLNEVFKEIVNKIFLITPANLRVSIAIMFDGVF